jgi:bifunctional enzyme CysN/CysC
MNNPSNANHASQPLKVVFVGHVDHGKSTLVGRLFHDTNSLPEGKFEAIQEMCKRRGMPFEWSFLMDALQAERDQCITIDTAQIWFSSAKRDYVIIDAPGHKEFLKNMVTGASGSDAAVLVIDADEGVQEQTKRHGLLLKLLGISQVVTVINKMDLVEHSRERFETVKADLIAYLEKLGVTPAFVIPASGKDGDNLASLSAKTDWYEGPTLLGALDEFSDPTRPTDLPLRIPIQDVYKFDQRRIIAGRIESGVLRAGDTVRFSPTGKTVRVASLESWNEAVAPVAAGAGTSVGFTLDEPIFVERGQVASHVERHPIETNQFTARLFWFGHTPLEVGRRYTLKINTGEYQVDVKEIKNIIDSNDLSSSSGDKVERNAVADVVLRSRGMMSIDRFSDNENSGRFVLIDDYTMIGGGNILEAEDLHATKEIKATNIYSVQHRVAIDVRNTANGHKSGILWLTGLSGSGKSTLAMELEHQLHRKGYQTYVLDGDNVRGGLNSDLGFSHEDRTENIRRIGEMAAIFADAGFIVITAFISPYRADRNLARAILPERFHEVFIKADLDTCESRDPKGLYKKARRGEISDFTGISAPYEEPQRPELVIDTNGQSVDESLMPLVGYVRRAFSLEQLKREEVA